MRITILANRDLPSNFALNLLVPELRRHELSLFLSDRVGKPSAHRPQELVDLKFLEQDLFNWCLFPLLEQLGNETRQRYLSFDQLGERYSTPVASLNEVNRPEGLAVLRARDPDLILSIRYGRILKDEAIAVPRYGVLNLHSGLLPAYRGVLATFRALVNGDQDVGCTLHYITDGTIDTGPVVARATVPVDLSKSLMWHVLALYPPGVRLMTDAVAKIDAGEPPETEPPASGEGAYFSYPTAEDFAAFREMGFKLFDGKEMTELLELYSA